MRETLIELVNNVLRCLPWGEISSHTAEDVADHLIDNGVTFATDNNVGDKWIPVSERLPNICEPVLVCCDFMGGKAFRVSDRYGKNGMLWAGIPDNHKVTHWMPLPEPPKGE